MQVGDQRTFGLVSSGPSAFPDENSEAAMKNKNSNPLLRSNNIRVFRGNLRSPGSDTHRDGVLLAQECLVSSEQEGDRFPVKLLILFVTHAFEDLDLQRVHAQFFTRNSASGRVLEKLGMKQEGFFPQYYLKWGVYEDVLQLGILKGDYLTPTED